MIDPLHDDLLFNLGSILGREGLKPGNPAIGTLEGMFLSGLRYCHDREDQLTGDDWVRIGSWLNECGEYFKDFDFICHSIALPTRHDHPARHDRDMSGFVEKATTAWASRSKDKDTR